MPRPRFTLRTILVVIALTAVLAWQGSMVWKRKLAMQSGSTFILARPILGEPAGAAPRVNPLRAWLGDEAVRLIYVVPQGDGEHDRRELTRLFPEATVKVVDPPSP